MTTSKTTEQHVDLDLDALRKAHADGHSPIVADRTFRLDGIVYHVAPRAPFFVASMMNDGDVEGALRLWLGDEQYDSFKASTISVDEFRSLFADVYGIDTGESEPSAS